MGELDVQSLMFSNNIDSHKSAISSAKLPVNTVNWGMRSGNPTDGAAGNVITTSNSN